MLAVWGDWSIQEAMKEAKKANPEGKRQLGVVKPVSMFQKSSGRCESNRIEQREQVFINPDI